MAGFANRKQYDGRVNVQEMEGFTLACAAETDSINEDEDEFIDRISRLADKTRDVAAQVRDRMQEQGFGATVGNTTVSVIENVLIRTFVELDNVPESRDSRFHLGEVVQSVKWEIDNSQTRTANNKNFISSSLKDRSQTKGARKMVRREGKGIPRDVKSGLEDIRTEALPRIYQLRNEFLDTAKKMMAEAQEAADDVLLTLNDEMREAEKVLDEEKFEELQNVHQEVESRVAEIQEAWEDVFTKGKEQANSADQAAGDIDEELKNFVK